MSLATEIRDALVELEGELGETFTWRGRIAVPCVPDMSMRGVAVVVGAKEWVIAFALNVRKANFLTADSTLVSADSTLWTADNSGRHPVAGMTLVFRGRTYKVATVSDDPTSVYYRLTLVDVNSGR